MVRTRLGNLKSLGKNVDWGSKDGRVQLLDDLWNLIRDWAGKPPKFEEVFHEDEIHALLTECATNSCHDGTNISRNKSIVKFVAKSGFRDKPVDGESLFRVTALHKAGTKDQPDDDWREMVSDLFDIYNRFEANYEDDHGTTHFHVACKFGCYQVVHKFLKRGRVDPDRVCRRSGDLPLILALRSDNAAVYRLLLGRGRANPNAIDASKLTPLHHLCQRADYLERTNELFGLSRVKVDVDARCKGRTPLHVAVSLGHMRVAELLLEHGADPNCADPENGSTALHVIVENAKYHEGENWAEKFFQITDKMRLDVHLALSGSHQAVEEYLTRRLVDRNLTNGIPALEICRIINEYRLLSEMSSEIRDDIRRVVQIDARDARGNTPLHLALSLGHRAIVESLLKRDADPNLANAEGSTPLHVVCRRKYDDDLTELFFKIVGDVRKQVQVDVRDNEGRTPLQWAVANILPAVVDRLLERGAVLSTFVFPTEAHFAECFDARRTELAFKLRLARGLTEVVERLEKSGYDLDRGDATTIMRLFSRYGLFQRPWADHRSGYRDQVDFARRAVQMLMGREPYDDDRILFVCETLWKKFFRVWALYPFQKLIHYRLPEEICVIIIEKLSNEDLYSVCLAVED